MQVEARQKMYRFGEEYFPALDRDAYQWKAASDEADFKGIQVRLRNMYQAQDACHREQIFTGCAESHALEALKALLPFFFLQCSNSRP